MQVTLSRAYPVQITGRQVPRPRISRGPPRAARIQFRGAVSGGRYVFTHAFIAEGYRGRGWALMRGVLEDVNQRHITVTNYCPVLDRFIGRTLGTLRWSTRGRGRDQAACPSRPSTPR